MATDSGASGWVEGSTKVVAETDNFSIVTRSVNYGPDDVVEKTMVDHPGSTALVVVTSDVDQPGIVINRAEFKAGVGERIPSTPSVFIGREATLESMIEKAQAKVQGLTVESVRPLNVIPLCDAPGYSNERSHFFLAEVKETRQQARDSGLVVLTYDDAMDLFDSAGVGAARANQVLDDMGLERVPPGIQEKLIVAAFTLPRIAQERSRAA